MSKLNILICAATQFELLRIDEHLQKKDQSSSTVNFQCFVHGVGIPATIFSLTHLLSKESFGLVIQVGIAGSLNKSLDLGSVVQVVEECFMDLGAEEKDGSLLSLFDLGLVEKDALPFSSGKIEIDPAEDYAILPKVKGGTVNMVSGSEKTIAQVRKQFPAVEVESMEGGAAAYVCKSLGLAHLQIRAISNFVEPRNREGWQLEKSLNNLTNVIIEMIEEIEKANLEE